MDGIKSENLIVRSLGIVFLLTISFALFQGCAYGPAIYKSRMPPVIQSTTSEYYKTYLYGSLDVSNAPTYRYDEKNYISRFHALTVYGNKYFNGNFGLFGYLGNYRVKTDCDCLDGSLCDKTYGFRGFGPEVNLNLNIPINKTKIGLGIYTGLPMESGDYCTFLSECTEIDHDHEENDNMQCDEHLLFFSPYLIYTYNFSDYSYASFQVGAGMPGIASLDVTYKYKEYFFWASYAFDDMGSWDQYSGLYKLGSFTIGFGYRAFLISEKEDSE